MDDGFFFFEDAFDLNDVDDPSCFMCDQSFGGFYLCHLLIASSLLFKRVCPSIHLDIRLKTSSRPDGLVLFLYCLLNFITLLATCVCIGVCVCVLAGDL